VRLLHAIARTSMAFDDPNIVSPAGLVPLMALADRLGLPVMAASARPDGLAPVIASTRLPEAAEITYTAFTSKKTEEQVTARLIVRRVKALNKKAAWTAIAAMSQSPLRAAGVPARHHHHRRPHRPPPRPDQPRPGGESPVTIQPVDPG
jgi:hypothetical protein